MPRPIEFSLDEIAHALQDAGTDYDQRAEIGRALFAIIAERRRERNRRTGRPPENDDTELLEVARLVQYEGMNANAAATLVTADLPPPKRKAAQRRIYRKFKKDLNYWLDEARLSPIQEEIRRLRGLLGDTSSRADFRELIRLVLTQKKTGSSE